MSVLKERDTKLVRAIEHLRISAGNLTDGDWSQANLDALACDVGIALMVVAEAIETLHADILATDCAIKAAFEAASGNEP